MGEEAGGYNFYFGGGGGAYGEYDGRVTEWETGLPGCDELTPLSQPLVPPGLAAARGGRGRGAGGVVRRLPPLPRGARGPPQGPQATPRRRCRTPDGNKRT